MKKARAKKPVVKRRPKKPAEWVTSLTSLAAIIAGEFKISCAKQNIVNWKKWMPPFPAPDVNRYNLPACRAWVTANIVKTPGEPTDEQRDLFNRALVAESQSIIDRARKDKAIADELERVSMSRALAERTSLSILKKYDGFVRRQLERNWPLMRKQQLELLGGDAVLVAAFYDYDLVLAKSAMNEIRVSCMEAAESAIVPAN